MRGLRTLVICCGLLVAAVPAQADDLASLQAEVDRVIVANASPDVRDTLAARLFAYAGDAESRSRFWSTMSIVATLCDAGPRDRARVWRATALRTLAHRFDDANRWSALLTTRFIPNLSGLSATERAEAIAAYDALLVGLAADAPSERVECELGFARAAFAVYLNRAGDWMPDARRVEAVRDLDTLRMRFGDLPCPGSGDGTRTVATRAALCADELTTMHFGAVAPAITGVDLEGRPFDLAEHRGRVVVLDFWTSFCQPCLALVPGARAMLERLEGEPVAFVGINGDEDRALGLRAATSSGMTWPSVWDGPAGAHGPAALAYHVPAMGWPSVFVLDRRGRIRAKLYGREQVERHLEPTVRALLAE